MLIGNRYETAQRLASGGQAELWLAWDRETGRQVVVKLGDSALREARTMIRVAHPCVARVFDAGDGYLAMEHVEGKSLAELGRVSITRALEIVCDVAAGLRATHAEGIVHRDIKPGNVMVTEAGQVKLLDYGLAKAQDLDEVSVPAGAHRGTTSWLSPEQVDRELVDHRSDIFSLGTLLYWLVTGEHPFADSSALADMVTQIRISAAKPDTPHELNPEIPLPVSRLIMRMLSRSPRWRPPLWLVIWVLGPYCGRRKPIRARAVVAIAGAVALLAAGAWWLAVQPEELRLSLSEIQVEGEGLEEVVAAVREITVDVVGQVEHIELDSGFADRIDLRVATKGGSWWVTIEIVVDGVIWGASYVQVDAGELDVLRRVYRGRLEQLLSRS